ncbi:DUF4276 family protein [Anthocerotibacter panamensis]|uniref:DUF4276 family protein n=1 Tax=Anthocerotibacter panamensis TaxID=2857077 RepID=UPI001C403211
MRIVCQELEAWFLGDFLAIESAFSRPGLAAKYQNKQKFRNPDNLGSPSNEIEKLLREYNKVSGAQLIAPHLDFECNRSPSFQAFLMGVRRLSGYLET